MAAEVVVEPLLAMRALISGRQAVLRHVVGANEQALIQLVERALVEAAVGRKSERKRVVGHVERHKLPLHIAILVGGIELVKLDAAPHGDSCGYRERQALARAIHWEQCRSASITPEGVELDKNGPILIGCLWRRK